MSNEARNKIFEKHITKKDVPKPHPQSPRDKKMKYIKAKYLMTGSRLSTSEINVTVPSLQFGKISHDGKNYEKK